MTRRRTSLITGGLAVTVIAIAAALDVGLASAAATHTIRVRGSAVRQKSSSHDVPFTFSVNAATGAPRNGVNGTFSGSFPHDPYPTPDRFPAPGNFATFSGVVTCLHVSGRAATIGGVITRGNGYDSDTTTTDGYSLAQRNLTGDWFIIVVKDPKGRAPDTMSYVDFGDRSYFTTASYHYASFSSMCSNPAADVGSPKFPLASGDIRIGS